MPFQPRVSTPFPKILLISGNLRFCQIYMYFCQFSANLCVFLLIFGGFTVISANFWSIYWVFFVRNNIGSIICRIGKNLNFLPPQFKVLS